MSGPGGAWRITGGPTPLRGRVRVPGDKSIAHRSALLGALGGGVARISGFPDGADNQSTLSALETLGATVRRYGSGRVEVDASAGLRTPAGPVDCGNSGTTVRLLMGLLAGRSVEATLTGDPSLSRRPMARVADPLAALGARVELDGEGGTLPARVVASPLLGAEVPLEVASAQVKSALLLAGLGAEGTTRVTEPWPSRDHTERMLAGLGAPIRFGSGWAEIDGGGPALAALDAEVPGDPSSAAFLATLGCLAADARIELPDVLLNPTRTGFLRVLERMGAPIEVRDRRESGGEELGTLVASSGGLRATEVAAPEVPSCIDELPILAVAMARARGTSRVTGAGELRVKECDRVAATTALLRAFGADVDEHEDGWTIRGPAAFAGAGVATHGDHRIVLSACVAAALARGESRIADATWADVSYPGFLDILRRLGVSARDDGGP